MVLEKAKFQNYTLSEDKVKKDEVVSVKLNLEEYAQLKENMVFLQQSKESTAIKQLMDIATKVLREEKIKEINQIVMNNYRKNKRLGIIEFD